MRHCRMLALGIALAAGIGWPLIADATQTAASEWVEGHNSRARLIGGGAGMVGVELQLPEGWKTYWRSPGEAGGVPPSFDWSKSANLASAKVLYPAPKRFTDRSGDTVGYKGTIVFPVRLEAKDPAQPIDLNLAFDYGVCKQICIPAQAELSLSVAPDAGQAMSEEMVEAMTRLPSPPEAHRENDPVVKQTRSELSGDNPQVIIEAQFPDGGAAADVFVEAPDGLYVPPAKKLSDDGKGGIAFKIDLSKDADIGALKGKQLTATLVSEKGQSEVSFPLQ